MQKKTKNKKTKVKIPQGTKVKLLTVLLKIYIIYLSEWIIELI